MDDERVLSPVISKAMSSKRTPGYIGVAKVRESVTSLLQHKESSKDSQSHALIYINAHEVYLFIYFSLLSNLILKRIGILIVFN